MTVAELIEVLKALPQEAEVGYMFQRHDSMEWEITTVTDVSIYLDPDTPEPKQWVLL